MSHNIGDTNEEESGERKKGQKSSWAVWPNPARREKFEWEVKKKKRKTRRLYPPVAQHRQWLAPHSAQIWRKKKQAMSHFARVRHSEKNMHRLGILCIDPSTMTLYDLFFSLSPTRGPIHAREPSPSETKQNIIEHDWGPLSKRNENNNNMDIYKRQKKSRQLSLLRITRLISSPQDTFFLMYVYRKVPLQPAQSILTRKQVSQPSQVSLSVSRSAPPGRPSSSDARPRLSVLQSEIRAFWY